MILVLSLVIIALVAGCAFYFSSSPTDAPPKVVDLTGHDHVSVVLTNDGFSPQEIRITKGTTVTFSTTRANPFWPASNPHPTHEIYPEFDPKQGIAPDQTWSFVFDMPGAWGYHDHIRSYFTGTVYVE